MAEETIQKKTGAERQAAFLVTALERASQQNGVLLNGTKKQTPRFFDKGLRVNPVNALIMAIHSDMGGFKTNSYVLFNDTKNRGEAVRKGEREFRSYGQTTVNMSTRIILKTKSPVRLSRHFQSLTKLVTSRIRGRMSMSCLT